MHEIDCNILRLLHENRTMTLRAILDHFGASGDDAIAPNYYAAARRLREARIPCVRWDPPGPLPHDLTSDTEISITDEGDYAVDADCGGNDPAV